MRNFQDTFETRKRSFISAFSICMTVPLIGYVKDMLESNISCSNELKQLQGITTLGSTLGRQEITLFCLQSGFFDP